MYVFLYICERTLQPWRLLWFSPLTSIPLSINMFFFLHSCILYLKIISVSMADFYARILIIFSFLFAFALWKSYTIFYFFFFTIWFYLWLKQLDFFLQIMFFFFCLVVICMLYSQKCILNILKLLSRKIDFFCRFINFSPLLSLLTCIPKRHPLTGFIWQIFNEQMLIFTVFESKYP